MRHAVYAFSTNNELIYRPFPTAKKSIQPLKGFPPLHLTMSRLYPSTLSGRPKRSNLPNRYRNFGGVLLHGDLATTVVVAHPALHQDVPYYIR